MTMTVMAVHDSHPVHSFSFQRSSESTRISLTFTSFQRRCHCLSLAGDLRVRRSKSVSRGREGAAAERPHGASHGAGNPEEKEPLLAARREQGRPDLRLSLMNFEIFLTGDLRDKSCPYRV